MFANVKAGGFLGSNQLSGQTDSGNQLLESQFMADKTLEVVDLESLGLEDLFNKHGRRSDAHLFERANHFLGHLGDDLRADVDGHVGLFTDQQNAVVSVTLRVEARILGSLIRPVAVHEKIPQIDFVPSFAIFLFANGLTAEGSEINRATAPAVKLGIRREEKDKADDGDRNDHSP